MAKNKRGNKKGLAVACLLASICGKTGAMEKPVNVESGALQRTNLEKSSNLKKVLIVGGTIFGLGAFGAGIYGLTKLFGDKEELDNGNQKPVEDPIKKEYFDILRSFYEPNTEYGAEYRCKDDNDNILDIQKFYSSSQPKCIEDTDEFLAYCTFALTFGKVSESGKITYEGYRDKKKLSIKLQIDKKQNNMRLEAKEDDGVKYNFYINLPEKHDDSINEKEFKIYLFSNMLNEFEYAIVPKLETENEHSKTFFQDYSKDGGRKYDDKKINGILDDFDNSENDGTLDATEGSCLRLFKANFEVSDDLTQLKATYNLIDKKGKSIGTNKYSIKINSLTEPGRKEPGDDEVNDKKENSDSQNINQKGNNNSDNDDSDDIGLGGLF
ncbi:MAG: hypothetical protein IJQ10_03990 [Clostridia bacterium]|nr:hypothetical protein [Clostridia bacterium]